MILNKVGSLVPKLFNYSSVLIIAMATHGALASSYLNRHINSLIYHRMPHALVGITVANARTGRILYDYQGLRYFTPASNMKIFTAAAALSYLGQHYRFHTTLSTHAHMNKGILLGDLVINFSGDPSLQVSDLKKMITRLRQMGVHYIKGNVIIDALRFIPPNYAPGWTQNTINWYYSAPITAAALNQNAIVVRLKANHHLGSRTAVKIEHYGQFFDLTDRIIAVSAKQASQHCSLIMKSNGQNDFYLGGCWPARKDDTLLKLAINNPLLFAKKIVKVELRDNHIDLKGHIILDHSKGPFRTLVDHQSATLASLVVEMIKHSNNFYAECLLKTLGAAYYHQGNFQNGVLAEKAILNKSMGIDLTKAIIFDGSGQSYYDAIFPQQLVALLYHLQHLAIYKAFYHALPVSGVDGTLVYRMANKLRGKVHAKTGTLTMGGGSSLCGYVTTLSGRKLIFSIMVNHASNLAVARRFEDHIIKILYHDH